jgi:hypothetical protein
MSVFTSPQIRVSINNQQRESVRTVGVIPIAVNRLSRLSDVDASDPNNNETLVYDSVREKYVVKTLPIVDGGSY